MVESSVVGNGNEFECRELGSRGQVRRSVGQPPGAGPTGYAPVAEAGPAEIREANTGVAVGRSQIPVCRAPKRGEFRSEGDETRRPPPSLLNACSDIHVDAELK